MRAAIVSPRLDQPAVSVGTWPRPVVPPGQVLVKVVRSALNHNDALILGTRETLRAPSISGSDAAGIVAATAADVSDHAEGDEVVVLPSLNWGPDRGQPLEAFEILGDESGGGTHAEYVVVPSENVFSRPRLFSWEEAAALPLAGVTAWRGLVTRGDLRAGQTVVITAASSGVGTLAIQIATALGARVIAVSSSARRMEAARALGAHTVISRTSDEYPGQLLTAVSGGADLVLDSTGDWDPLLSALRRGGRLVTVGKTGTRHATATVGKVFWEHLSILGTSMGSPKDFAELLEHVSHRPWAPVIDSVFGLSDVSLAYERLASPDRVGKVVLDPSR